MQLRLHFGQQSRDLGELPAAVPQVTPVRLRCCFDQRWMGRQRAAAEPSGPGLPLPRQRAVLMTQGTRPGRRPDEETTAQVSAGTAKRASCERHVVAWQPVQAQELQLATQLATQQAMPQLQTRIPAPAPAPAGRLCPSPAPGREGRHHRCPSPSRVDRRCLIPGPGPVDPHPRRCRVQGRGRADPPQHGQLR